MDIPLSLYIFFSFSLITFSAFISGSKKAFFALDRSETGSLAESEGNPALRFLAERPRRTLLTFLILHQLLLILLVLLTILTFTQSGSRGTALIILFLFYLFVGRALPRALVLGRELLFIRKVSPILKVFFFLLSPLRGSVEKVASFLLREGGRLSAPVIQDRDFKNLMVRQPEETEAYERAMIQNVMDFRRTLVKAVMTPRPDMFCLDVATALPDVIEQVRNARFSRIPVFEGDLDHIVGILYAKDLLPLLRQGVESSHPFPRFLLHHALHVPETKHISELLREFKKQNVHIAMVVDEFGGVEGLVCLEDLLEEIVGEIQDEADVEEQLSEQMDERTYRVSAMMPLEDFKNLFGAEIESEEVETIGGFVLQQLGHFPKWGEKVRHENLEFVVQRVEGVRILELTVTRLDSETDRTSEPEKNG